MDINEIVTPLDSAVLDSKEQYSLYYRIVEHALKELSRTIEKERICTYQEVTFFQQYCNLLIYSLEAMRIKYMYDEEENMKIDLTESGFPNYLEFRFLINDLELRHQFIDKLPKHEVIKKEFLDQLLKEKRSIGREKLYQAASLIYYTGVEKERLFKRFVQGKVMQANDSVAQYIISWSFYDVSYNRPFFCYMYFNYAGKNVEDITEEIYEVLRQVADRKMDLDSMAYAIDKKIPKILPVKLKRLDLGPLHTVFAKDENIITHSLLESIIKKDVDLESMIISFKVDEIETKGAHKDGNFFNSQYLQIWDEPKHAKYLFANHWLIQLLYTKIPDVIDLLTKPPIEINEVPRLEIRKKQ